MRVARLWWVAAAGLSVAACDGGGPTPAATGTRAATASPAPTDSAATRGYRQSMASMMHAAPPYSGDADVDFNRQMRVHHLAAVAMAEVELAHGRDPQSLELARSVIRAQRAEIAQIDAWLARRAPH